MQLLTKALQRTIPPLYSQEHVADPICYAKFFLPDGPSTWYVIEGSTREKAGCGFGGNCHYRPLTEYDPTRDDVLFFGYIEGYEPELGYFTLSELAAIHGGFGLSVERDMYFEPCRLSQVKKTTEPGR